MRKLVLAGLVAGLGGIVAPAVQAEDAGSLAMATNVLNQGAVHAAGAPMRAGHAGHRGAWGTRVNGRWSAGWNAPGGWNGYRRPVAGVALPSYWINPSYYISDYQGYGLPAPAQGYGWSRYYDDAVMTDRYGRVTDVRYGYDWDRFGGYEDGYDGAGYADGYDDRGYDDRRPGGNNAVAGAVVGGVVGGVAGNLIAGKGNRLPGTIIGAGVGAVAGAAIGGASDRRDDRRAPGYGAPGYDARGYDGPGPRKHAKGRPAGYDGQWVGTWYGDDGRVYSGTYDGEYAGTVKGSYGRQTAYRPAPLPAPAPGFGYGAGYGGAGYSSYGYDYSAYGASGYAYETLDYVAPTVVTTTVTTEETVYAARKAVRKPVVRKKVRAKPRVVCRVCLCTC